MYLKNRLTVPKKPRDHLFDDEGKQKLHGSQVNRISNHRNETLVKPLIYQIIMPDEILFSDEIYGAVILKHVVKP